MDCWDYRILDLWFITFVPSNLFSFKSLIFSHSRGFLLSFFLSGEQGHFQKIETLQQSWYVPVTKIIGT